MYAFHKINHEVNMNDEIIINNVIKKLCFLFYIFYAEGDENETTTTTEPSTEGFVIKFYILYFYLYFR